MILDAQGGEVADQQKLNFEIWARSRGNAARRGLKTPKLESSSQNSQNDSVPETSKTAARVIIPCHIWLEQNFFEPESVNRNSAGYDYRYSSKIVLEPDQRDILAHIGTPDEDGYLPYQTIIWSEPKKSGKTTIAGGFGAWFADQVDPPNLVLTLANSERQSASRIFAAMMPTLNALGARVPKSLKSNPEIALANGTNIQAIGTNYAGEAGANYGCTLTSELWGYTTEAARRLYDETPPIQTRKNSIRFIETYAGFIDESELLLELHKQIFTDPEETGFQPMARPVPGLEHIRTDNRPACWHIPERGLFVYWSHEQKREWQKSKRGKQLIENERATMRPSSFVRLYENRWQLSEGGFIPIEWFKRSCRLRGARRAPMILAADASMRHDTTALVGIEPYITEIFGVEETRYRMAHLSIWNPGGKDIDLEETLADEVFNIWKQGLMIGAFWYDPFQMHQVAINLRKRGVPCAEFNQQSERKKADSFLYKQYSEQTIDNWFDPDFEKHIVAARAKEYDNEEIRIVKGTIAGSSKIDAVVAQSMAVYRASIYLQNRPRKKKRKTQSYDASF